MPIATQKKLMPIPTQKRQIPGGTNIAFFRKAFPFNLNC